MDRVTKITIAFLLISSCTLFAQAPRVTPFIYGDSVAAELEFSPIFTQARLAKLEQGYPISFRMTIGLYRVGGLWPDRRVVESSAEFRVLYRKMEGRYETRVVDYTGSRSAHRHKSVPLLIGELEEQLWTTLSPVDSLDEESSYFFRISISYRDLTVNDVRSTDNWLRGNQNTDSLRTDRGEGTVTDDLLGLIWRFAGLREESFRSETARFKPNRLRRAE